jgi:hypothetical protein
MTTSSSLLVLVLAASSQPAARGVHYVCHAVGPGDTASRIALRLTGNAELQHSPALYVVDTSRSRIISKRDYDLIHPGWHVCIAQGMLSASPRRASRLWVSTRERPVRQPAFLASMAALDFDYRWGLPPLFVAALLAWLVTKQYRRQRRTTLATMRRFADSFIREFEHPLFRQRRERPPIVCRLRCAPHRKLLKISLAPGLGRTYPNLSDHRKNLEYDVARVLRVLKNEAFTSGKPYTWGSWVVIPFWFRPGTHEEGAM